MLDGARIRVFGVGGMPFPTGSEQLQVCMQLDDAENPKAYLSPGRKRPSSGEPEDSDVFGAIASSAWKFKRNAAESSTDPSNHRNHPPQSEKLGRAADDRPGRLSAVSVFSFLASHPGKAGANRLTVMELCAQHNRSLHTHTHTHHSSSSGMGRERAKDGKMIPSELVIGGCHPPIGEAHEKHQAGVFFVLRDFFSSPGLCELRMTKKIPLPCGSEGFRERMCSAAVGCSRFSQEE